MRRTRNQCVQPEKRTHVRIKLFAKTYWVEFVERSKGQTFSAAQFDAAYTHEGEVAKWCRDNGYEVVN